MKRSLRSKLTLSYAVMALLLVAVISFFINLFFKIQFKDYVLNLQKQNSQTIIKLVEQQYDPAAGAWNVSAVENIGMSALEQGLILKVKDTSGTTVWDATVHNNGLCVQMLAQMAENMTSLNPNFKGGYVETSYTLTANFNSIGKADIGSYGPYYYTNDDVRFLNRINTVLAAVGFASLLAALLLGAIMSKRISRPISKAVETALQISKGNFKQRIEEKSGTREIVQLTDTVNALAGSLEKQEGLRRRMAADVAHELRTPLATLQSSLEAFIDGVWEPSSERLESCHEEILRINRLVGDLEKLERFEADNLRLNRTGFDLTELARHILNNYQPDFLKKGITPALEGESVLLEADKDKISQVLNNLFSNALKYTPEKGNVEVTVKDDNKTVELTVGNSGKGIPPADLPYIFERFYRADKSRNRLTGGSGLGLTIVKAIVEAHNGQISVASEPDKQTVFKISLPKK